VVKNCSSVDALNRLNEELAKIPKAKGVIGRDKKGQTRGSKGKPRVDEPPTLAKPPWLAE
jgi:hypothetical protein